MNGVERLAMMLSETEQGVMEGEWLMWDADFVGHVSLTIVSGGHLNLPQSRCVTRLAGKYLCRDFISSDAPSDQPKQGCENGHKP